MLLGLGYILRLIKVLSSGAVKSLNKLSFVIFLPVLLFYTVYDSKLEDMINLKLIGITLTLIVALFILLCLVIPMLEKDNRKRGVLVQGLLRSNVGVFGLPIAFALCGDGNVGPIPLMVAVAIPAFSALSIIALELFRGEKLQPMKVLRAVVTNPLIISALLGLICLFLGFRFPTAVDAAIEDVAGLATPLALIVLGSSFQFKELQGYRKQLIIGLLGKLIVVPLICLPLCIWIGYRGVDLVSLLIVFAAPPAVSTYTVAEQMDGDATLAGQLVVLGSILAIPVIFCMIFVLKQLGLL